MPRSLRGSGRQQRTCNERRRRRRSLDRVVESVSRTNERRLAAREAHEPVVPLPRPRSLSLAVLLEARVDARPQLLDLGLGLGLGGTEAPPLHECTRDAAYWTTHEAVSKT